MQIVQCAMSHALQHLWVAPLGCESLTFQLKDRKYYQGRDGGAVKHGLPQGLSVTVRAAAAGGLSRDDEGPCTLKDFSNLAEQLLGLKTVVRDSYRTVGPEMRDRVDRLFDRTVLLKNSAERTPGGRIPAQLIATLKALQRECYSLENIVTKALEAGPLLDDLEGRGPNVDDSGASGSRLQEEPKSLVFQSLVRESEIVQINEKILKPQPRSSYVMTSPTAFGSSPLAKFRAEIERRVVEKLVENKKEYTPALTAVLPPKEVDLLSASAIQSKWAATSERLFSPPLFGKSSSTKATSRAGVTAQRPLEAAMLGVEEVRSTEKVAEVEVTAQRIEIERLKGHIARYKSGYKEARMRADAAESQVRRLTEKIMQNVPSDMHEEMVLRFRDSVADARVKVAQITAETREKEVMLAAVKQQLLSERKGFELKVAELTGELASRVTLKEMEAAINSAVDEVQKELVNAQERASTLSCQVDEKERTLNEMREKWTLEEKALKLEVVTVNEKLKGIENERVIEKRQLIEAMQRVRLLEEELVKIRKSQDPSMEERTVADGENWRTKQLINEVSGSMDVSDGNDGGTSFQSQSELSARQKEAPLSEEKVEALEKFFTMMGGVINKQDIEVDFWILGVQVPPLGGTPVIRRISNVQD